MAHFTGKAIPGLERTRRLLMATCQEGRARNWCFSSHLLGITTSFALSQREKSSSPKEKSYGGSPPGRSQSPNVPLFRKRRAAGRGEENCLARELGLPLGCSQPEYEAWGRAGEQGYEVKTGQLEGPVALNTLHTHQPTKSVCPAGRMAGEEARSESATTPPTEDIQGSLVPSEVSSPRWHCLPLGAQVGNSCSLSGSL